MEIYSIQQSPVSIVLATDTTVLPVTIPSNNSIVNTHVNDQVSSATLIAPNVFSGPPANVIIPNNNSTINLCTKSQVSYASAIAPIIYDGLPVDLTATTAVSTTSSFIVAVDAGPLNALPGITTITYQN